MTRTLGSGLQSLRDATTGVVIGPDDPEYDEARRVWNAAIDRRPAVVVRCADVADVQAAIAFARAEDLEITVRGGAHNPSGSAVTDDGLMIDMSLFDGVTVDPQARLARVGGGATLAQVDAATQEHGLAIPAGHVSHTGVAGLTLGGGMGHLTPRAGLVVDNLVSAQLVTADGRVLRAAAEENPDLFWAVRGGGGNFGVVTEFEFRLHECGPIVHIGMPFWGLDKVGAVLRLVRDLVPGLPSGLSVMPVGLNFPPAPFVPEEHRLQPGCTLLVIGWESPEQLAELLERIRAAVPPLFEMTTPMPYVGLQQMMDEATAWGMHAYEKGTYIEELTDAVIEVIAEHLPLKTSPASVLVMQRLDGAFLEVADADTAFGGSRIPQYQAFIVGLVPDAASFEQERAWVRGLWSALQPHVRSQAGYLNALAELDDDRVRAGYGAKYPRLAAIKAVYDPENVFHCNANIRPASR